MSIKASVAFLLSAALLPSGVRAAVLRDVQTGAIPDWVLPPPATSEQKLSDAPFRMVYWDAEDHVSNGTLESYKAYRIKILKPEALVLGNVTINWSPDAGPAVVHFVRIIRNGTPIDVLAQTKFQVIEREAGLAQSVLDGALTATLQVPGLQVGDELEFAGTIDRSEPALSSHVAAIEQLPFLGVPGTYRYRLVWPDPEHLTWRASKDLPRVAPTKSQGSNQILLDLRDPPAPVDVEGAPSRYNVRGLVEFTDYSSWRDLSQQFWALFDKASQIAPDSPLRTEAAKIAAASPDPTERAESALRLVQDQIRYVYVGLEGANYRPATADETWQRRFGDCKAKTVVLLALLRQLGIEAEPALVNSKGGDGTDERLPTPILFDHALVRATLNGRTLWLDGTRLGDRDLDRLPPPVFLWALPLRSAGADLISIPPRISRYPQFISLVDIDATAGLSNPATVTASDIYHGDEAFEIKTKLSSLSPTDAARAIKAYWHGQGGWIDVQTVVWRYDERHASVMLGTKGTAKLEWDGDDKEGHSYSLPGAGFTPPDRLERPSDQDHAPWAVQYPRFRCWATTIHLPPAKAPLHWSYSSAPVNRRLGGVIYWREAGMRGNMVRTVMSRQSYVREISASEAAQVNSPDPRFDNYMSTVDETRSALKGVSTVLPFRDATDWMADPAPCSPPAK